MVDPFLYTLTSVANSETFWLIAYSVLGYQTSTIYQTSKTTVTSTAISYAVTGTQVIPVATITALPTISTVTASEVTVTSCISPNALGKRQASNSRAVLTPSALSGGSPASISLICSCLNPPTPSTTATVTQTSVYVAQKTVATAATKLITTTITPVSLWGIQSLKRSK